MSPRAAASRCTYTRCPNIATERGRCDDHRDSGWVERRRLHDQRGSASSTSASSSAVAEWKRQVRAANPDGVCYVCGMPGADEVDHIVPILEGGAVLDPANGGLIHEEPCHRRKTARELAKARGKYRGRTY